MKGNFDEFHNRWLTHQHRNKIADLFKVETLLAQTTNCPKLHFASSVLRFYGLEIYICSGVCLIDKPHPNFRSRNSGYNRAAYRCNLTVLTYKRPQFNTDCQCVSNLQPDLFSNVHTHTVKILFK